MIEYNGYFVDVSAYVECHLSATREIASIPTFGLYPLKVVHIHPTDLNIDETYVMSSSPVTGVSWKKSSLRGCLAKHVGQSGILTGSNENSAKRKGERNLFPWRRAEDPCNIYSHHTPTTSFTTRCLEVPLTTLHGQER